VIDWIQVAIVALGVLLVAGVLWLGLTSPDRPYRPPPRKDRP
jgi:hypothetical protein